jgi:hypothetical protein
MFEHLYQDGFISRSFLSYAPMQTLGQNPVAQYLAELSADVDQQLFQKAPDESLLLKQLQQLAQLLEDIPDHEIDRLLAAVNHLLENANTRIVRIDNEIWLTRKNQSDGDQYFVATLKTLIALN